MVDLTGGGGEVRGASSAVGAVGPPAGAGARARVLMGGLVMAPWPLPAPAGPVGPAPQTAALAGPTSRGGPARGAVLGLARVLGDLGSGSQVRGRLSSS